MTKAITNYKGIFSPKYRAFHILQNKIEEVVQQSTQIWKVIYGLTTQKVIEKAPKEVGEDKEEQDVVEVTNDESIREVYEEGTTEATTKEEQQQDQNVP